MLRRGRGRGRRLSAATRHGSAKRGIGIPSRRERNWDSQRTVSEQRRASPELAVPLSVQQPAGNLGPMGARMPLEGFDPLGALVVAMQGVLPREPDAAV